MLLLGGFTEHAQKQEDCDSLHESLRSSVHIVFLRSPVTLNPDFAFSISSNVPTVNTFPRLNMTSQMTVLLKIRKCFWLSDLWSGY